MSWDSNYCVFLVVQLQTTEFTKIVGLFLPQSGGQENACYISFFQEYNLLLTFPCSSDHSHPTKQEERHMQVVILFLWSISSLCLDIISLYGMHFPSPIKTAFIFEQPTERKGCQSFVIKERGKEKATLQKQM